MARHRGSAEMGCSGSVGEFLIAGPTTRAGRLWVAWRLLMEQVGFAEMGRMRWGGCERIGERIQKSSMATICLTCLGDPKGRCQVAAGYEGRSS